MDEMQRQMADFVSYVRNEVMLRAQHATADAERGAIVPVRHPILIRQERKTEKR